MRGIIYSNTLKLRTFLNKLLIPATLISSTVYIVWRIFFTLPFEYGVLALTIGTLLLIVEVIGIFEAAIHFYSMPNIKSPEKPTVDESLFPHVDIFIATYNEPANLLFKTINGCNHLDYPDKSKIHVYICDDGNRREIKELAEKMNIHYITRTDRSHAKAGNLNNALAVTSSPLVVTLDADMIPMSEFLTSCVPYFLTGEKIGFLQTPQAFYNLDLYQYYLYSENRIPNEQDYFYKTVQVSRNKDNTVIYGGSNTIISRAALEEIGGFITEVITEDFATGMAIQSNGYRCIAIDQVHASGLSPEDLKSLIKQRERWARGCIQSGRKLNILFRHGLNIRQKLSYLSSITYWYSSFKRLFYIISPIVFSLFSIVVVKCTIANLLIFWLPMYMLNKISIKRLSNNIRSSKWSNVYDTILFPALLPVVLIESLGLTKTTFAVTRKDGIIDEDNQYRIKQMTPHIILCLLTLFGILSSISHIFITGSIKHLYIIFWLVINLYNILMSIFFMSGRDNYPEKKAAAAAVDCIIHGDSKTFECVTTFISEVDFTFTTNAPRYFKPFVEHCVILKNTKYSSQFKATLSNVVTKKDKLVYAFAITKIEENDYRQLLQLLYDRVPTTVQNLEVDNNAFDDIRINVVERLKPRQSIPKPLYLPEINVNRNYVTTFNKLVRILRYNYEYVSIAFPEHGMPTEFGIILDSDVSISCVFNKANTDGSITYSITNMKELETCIDKYTAQWFAFKTESIKINQESISYEFDEMMYV